MTPSLYTEGSQHFTQPHPTILALYPASRFYHVQYENLGLERLHGYKASCLRIEPDISMII